MTDPLMTQPMASVDLIASRMHADWLETDPRRANPYYRPWSELPEKSRSDLSRPVRRMLDVLIQSGVRVPFTDEYAKNAGEATVGAIGPVQA